MLAGCTFLRLSRPCSHSAAADVTAGKIYVPMKGEKLHKTMIGAILLQILLIFGNAVFASAEIAVISMNDAKLKRMTHDGDKRAKKLTALTEQPARFLATIQVAITLAGLMGGAFAAENFAGPLVGLLMSLGIPVPENVLHSVSVVLITLALTYFSLVFGELVPKRIAMKKPDSMALGMSGMLFGVWKLCKPVVWLLTFSTNQILRLLGVDPEEEDEVVTEEEIRMMLAEGREQGTIRPEESQMIQNVFEFDDTPAEQGRDPQKGRGVPPYGGRGCGLGPDHPGIPVYILPCMPGEPGQCHRDPGHQGLFPSEGPLQRVLNGARRGPAFLVPETMRAIPCSLP